MEWYLKLLIVLAVVVPVSVEGRTFGGMVGVELPLFVYVVGGVVLALLIVAVDELWWSGGDGVENGEGR